MHAHFDSNDSGLLSPDSPSEKKTSLCTFTALLICMENSFWNRYTGGNFVDWFKKSFALYVKSGMRMKVELAINILEYDPVGDLRPGFKEDFYKIIMDHYLSHHEDQVVG